MTGGTWRKGPGSFENTSSTARQGGKHAAKPSNSVAEQSPLSQKFLDAAGARCHGGNWCSQQLNPAVRARLIECIMQTLECRAGKEVSPC